MNVCQRVTYSGTVQGVGFRYTVLGVAQHYPVKGYVRNLPNGQVELVAEGPADQVAAFLQTVANRMAGYITGQGVTEEEPQGFRDFSVRP